MRSIAAPTWNRAPPAVHGRPSAPVCRELGLCLVAGSSCGSDPSPGWRGPRARAHTCAHSPAHTPASPLPAPHPPRGSSAGWGGGVTSGLQSRGERLERAARSSPSWEAGGALGRPRLPRSSLSSAPAVALPARGGASRAARWIESHFLGRTERVLQTWQALKLQLGQKRPSGGAGRGAPCAASPGGWGRSPLSSPPSAAARPRPQDSGPRRARPVETSQPYASRGGSGAGNASAPAPSHRREAAACRKARKEEGAAASARSKCSRSLRRFLCRSPGESGRLISCPRPLRIADLPATLAGRGERHGRVEDAGDQGRVGSHGARGGDPPPARSNAQGTGHRGLGKGGIWGERRWRLVVTPTLVTLARHPGVASQEGLRGWKRVSLGNEWLLIRGCLGWSIAAAAGPWKTGARGDRRTRHQAATVKGGDSGQSRSRGSEWEVGGSSEMPQSLRGKQRSRKRAGVMLRDAAVAVGRRWSFSG